MCLLSYLHVRLFMTVRLIITCLFYFKCLDQSRPTSSNCLFFKNCLTSLIESEKSNVTCLQIYISWRLWRTANTLLCSLNFYHTEKNIMYLAPWKHFSRISRKYWKPVVLILVVDNGWQPNDCMNIVMIITRIRRVKYHV